MYYLNNIINLSIEKFALKFFEKTKYGSLSVEFPSGKISKFEGKEYGVSAKIKLKNFLLIKKIVKRGAIGFAESYMDGDFNTDDLKNLLIFAEKNKSSFLIYSKKKKIN